MGLSICFMMHKHILNYHHYFTNYAFNPNRRDQIEKYITFLNLGDYEGNKTTLDGKYIDVDSDGGDRSSAFIIDETGNMGQTVYRVVGNGGCGAKVLHASAGQEPESENYCNVIRFMHELLPPVRTKLSSWVSTPHLPPLGTYLFT